MRAVIQRVNEAQVEIRGEIFSRIGRGLLLFVGVEEGDSEADIQWLAKKIAQMRIFPDEDGLMNRSIKDAGGALLLVSQFTLHAATKKGNRPSFIRAARPEQAEKQLQELAQALERETSRTVATGVFGEDMQISLVNDGPVTILIDSRQEL